MQGSRRRKLAASLVAATAVLTTAVPALADSPKAGSSKPKTGNWNGQTSLRIKGVTKVGQMPYDVTQKVPVKFAVANASGGSWVVKGFALGMFKVQCPPGMPNAKIAAVNGGGFTAKPKISSSGKFKISQTLSGRTLKVSGAFTTATQAKGTVSWSNTKSCATGTQAWTAKR